MPKTSFRKNSDSPRVLSYLYLNQSVEVPVASMMRSILLIVLLPVLAGTTINSFYAHLTHKLKFPNY
ncbi:hypothetical protein [Bathymodiolus japonicus methanotrophic gill symbiont]|uniref:hypothetical protein n=1 Tax=Bathymodiolus japonicus methanotrophic gill symbiont TaxID=113269 RepID=UPI003B835062